VCAEGWFYALLVSPSGLIVGFTRERSGSVLPAILLHMLMNSPSVAIEFLGL
jgi:membrane protease YdiL (CAAX protease family)